MSASDSRSVSVVPIGNANLINRLEETSIKGFVSHIRYISVLLCVASCNCNLVLSSSK